MKKRFICVFLMIVIMLIASLALVSCDNNDTNDDFVQVEYIKKDCHQTPLSVYLAEGYHEYIKFWYDESWFPCNIRLDFYDGDIFIGSVSNFSAEKVGGFIKPNSFVYLVFYNGEINGSLGKINVYDYNYLSIKIVDQTCYGYDANFEEIDIILATYTLELN